MTALLLGFSLGIAIALWLVVAWHHSTPIRLQPPRIPRSTVRNRSKSRRNSSRR
ncbi:hypothetical protein H6F51_07180 [Cyanobacteria bacterium FACHB-DQ100]|nr:hypothetical protein [Cyanobacteria bacterium FACHB-DQ100]